MIKDMFEFNIYALELFSNLQKEPEIFVITSSI